MTSVAFIAGSVPLLLGHGAGSEVRSATGITVFAGMLGVTIFGLFLTPVFYVALRNWFPGHGKDKALQHPSDAPQLVDEASEGHRL
jgi:multidrug efflux pump